MERNQTNRKKKLFFLSSCGRIYCLSVSEFNQIKDDAGDSLYFRAGFDRTGELNEGELRFVKDDILYVDTTIFRGKFGQWRAWKLDGYGHRLRCGIIPSQLK